MFHYTVTTEKTIDQVIGALEATLQEEAFGITFHLDMQQTLQGKGFDFNQPYHILEVCSPKAAYQALTQNQLIGYVLPCKIVVYDDHGTTTIGMPKPTALIDMVGDTELNDFAESVEQQLKKCMDKAK